MLIVRRHVKATGHGLQNSGRSWSTARRRCSMSFDLALQMSFRTAGWIDKSASARAHAAHLQDGIFLDRDIMRDVGWLGVKAAGRQDFQVGGMRSEERRVGKEGRA